RGGRCACPGHARHRRDATASDPFPNYFAADRLMPTSTTPRTGDGRTISTKNGAMLVSDQTRTGPETEEPGDLDDMRSRIEELLGEMTPADKAGQVTQY